MSPLKRFWDFLQIVWQQICFKFLKNVFKYFQLVFLQVTLFAFSWNKNYLFCLIISHQNTHWCPLKKRVKLKPVSACLTCNTWIKTTVMQSGAPDHEWKQGSDSGRSVFHIFVWRIGCCVLWTKKRREESRLLSAPGPKAQFCDDLGFRSVLSFEAHFLLFDGYIRKVQQRFQQQHRHFLFSEMM